MSSRQPKFAGALACLLSTCLLTACPKDEAPPANPSPETVAGAKGGPGGGAVAPTPDGPAQAAPEGARGAAGGSTTAAAAPLPGKKLFLTTCANCHGMDGTGALMRQMLPKIADLTSPEVQGRLSDEEMEKLIVAGRDKMPPFGSVFKPEQIKSIVAYVRTLRKG